MKFCMIGSRGHSYYVFESIAEVAEIDLCAVSSGCAEDSPDRLLTMAGRSGFSPKVFDDWKKMLDEVRPDLVSIDGKFDLHAEMCVESLKRNISVFCEKPIALTLSDLGRIKDVLAGSKAHIISMVGLRYQPDFQYALKLVRNGAIGKVKMVHGQKSYRLGKRPDYYKKRETFGGLIPWVGSHALDWIMAFSGSAFKNVYATQTNADNFDNGDMEIAAQCIGTMQNGVQFQASLDFLRPEKAPSHGDDRVRAVGTKGIIEVRGGIVNLIDDQGKRDLPVPPPERNLFSDFANSIAGKNKPFVSDEETIALTEACLLARESADTGKIISF